MDFYPDKKQVIIIAALAAGFLAGGAVLLRQGTFLAANLSGALTDEWVEIKPRVAGTGDKITVSEENGILKKEATPAKIASPAIQWCEIIDAASPLAEKQLIFNEVAWMGTAASYSDEWMELKNIGAGDLDLSGWQIQNKKRKIKIYFGENEILPAAGLYLLERTDDESVPGVIADKTYKGSLANTDEAIYLFDADCVLRDAAVALPKWPAGDNIAKKTMIRVPGLVWQNGIAGGTPKSENR